MSGMLFSFDWLYGLIFVIVERLHLSRALGQSGSVVCI